MDADLSHSPEAVPLMAVALEEADLVVGSRYCKGGGTRDTFTNKILSIGLNLLTWGLAPGVKDRVSGFFGIRKCLTERGIRSTCKPMLEYLVRENPRVVREVPYLFIPRTKGTTSLGRSYTVILKTLLEMVELYVQKFNRFIRFCLIGGFGAGLCIGATYLLTEYAGLWYMSSLVIGAFAAAVWNFTWNKTWTFGSQGHSDDADYEWNAWYSGNFLQKYWKRKIGSITKGFLGNPKVLLDVGCGSSPVINLFHCTRIGLEGNPGKIDFISKYSSAEFYQRDLGKGLGIEESLEAVICNNVLEHLQSPVKVIKDIGRLLEVGGLVVLTVPNCANPMTRITEWIYGKVMPGGYAKEHIAEFTSKSLDELCGEYGLKLVERKSVFTDMVCLYRREV